MSDFTGGLSQTSSAYFQMNVLLNRRRCPDIDTDLKILGAVPPRLQKFNLVNLPLMANLPSLADITGFIGERNQLLLSRELKLDAPTLADCLRRPDCEPRAFSQISDKLFKWHIACVMLALSVANETLIYERSPP